jgi:hypothetical protein
MHTFLFTEALWEATGWFTDHQGVATRAKGRARVGHEPGVWVNQGEMSLMTPHGAMTFETRYEFAPWPQEARATEFTFENPVLGLFDGRIRMRGATLLARATCPGFGGGWRTVEVLTMNSPRVYDSLGGLYRGCEQVSGWNVRLVLATPRSP